MTREEVLALATDDYQNRRGDAPESDIPDTISVYERSDGNFSILASFKNTSEDRAERWLEKFVDKKDLKIVRAVSAWQSGEYHDDWVDAEIVVSI